MADRYLYLIRHGQYDTTSRDPDGGSLTDLGHQQAQHTADALSHLPMTALYCSTMTRARETAQPFHATFTLDPQYDDDLREGLPSIPPRYAADILTRMETNPSLTHEVIHANQQRFDAAFDKYFIPTDSNTDQHECFVCHGNITRYLVCKALGINVDTWGKMLTHHGSITALMVNAHGQIELHSFNEIQHLPIDARTTG